MKRIILPLVLVFSAAARSAVAQPLRLSLDEAIRRGLDTSHRLAEAVAGGDLARAVVDERRAASRPQIAAQAGYARTNHVDVFGVLLPGNQLRVIYPDIPDNYRTRLDLQWPIYTAGRVDALERAARSEASASADELAVARSDLRLEIARAYWALVTATESERVVGESLNRVGAHLRDMRNHFTAGLVPPNEVLVVEAQESRQRMLSVQARMTRDNAEAELARLVGAPGTLIEPVSLQSQVASQSVSRQSPVTSRQSDSRQSQVAGRQSASRQSPVTSRQSGEGLSTDDLRLTTDGLTTGDLRLTTDGLTTGDLRLTTDVPTTDALTTDALTTEGLLTDDLRLTTEALASLIEQARQQRGERRSLVKRIAASDERQRAALAGMKPTVTIAGGFDYARPNPRIFPRAEAWKESWDAGVNLMWPLFDGGRARAEVAEMAAAARAIRERLAEFDSVLTVELRQRVNEIESSRAAIAAAQDAVRSAAEARRVVGDRFTAGVTASIDVLDAQVALLQAELDRTQAIANARLAEARLDRALGK